jgi:hypothetical protein
MIVRDFVWRDFLKNISREREVVRVCIIRTFDVIPKARCVRLSSSSQVRKPAY